MKGLIKINLKHGKLFAALFVVFILGLGVFVRSQDLKTQLQNVKTYTLAADQKNSVSHISAIELPESPGTQGPDPHGNIHCSGDGDCTQNGALLPPGGGYYNTAPNNPYINIPKPPNNPNGSTTPPPGTNLSNCNSSIGCNFNTGGQTVSCVNGNCSTCVGVACSAVNVPGTTPHPNLPGPGGIPPAAINPPANGSSPSSGGQGTSPASNTTGSSTPPSGGGSTPPSTGTNTSPSGRTGETIPPPASAPGSSSPTTPGSSTPPSGGGSTPPSTGTNTSPSGRGETIPPPASAPGSSSPTTPGSSTPPSGGGRISSLPDRSGGPIASPSASTKPQPLNLITAIYNSPVESIDTKGNVRLQNGLVTDKNGTLLSAVPNAHGPCGINCYIINGTNSLVNPFTGAILPCDTNCNDANSQLSFSSETQTPSPTPLSNSPASAPIASPTPTVLPIPVNFSISLPGIGNTPPDNPSPESQTQDITLALYKNDKLVTSSSSPCTYKNGVYNCTVTLQNVSSDIYDVYVKGETTLYKKAAKKIQLSEGKNTALSGIIALISGDLNQDNRIDLLDYNMLSACLANRLCKNKTISDLNSDGKVDELDLNILLRGLSIQTGDTPN